MKKLLILLIAASLSGCALLDAYLMKYEPNEYLQISEIRTLAFTSKNTCDSQSQAKQQAELIANKTLFFMQFVEHIPRNSKVINSSIELDKIAQGLKDQYLKSDKVSTAFCKMKFQSIEKSAELMQKTIGDKPR